MHTIEYGRCNILFVKHVHPKDASITRYRINWIHSTNINRECGKLVSVLKCTEIFSAANVRKLGIKRQFNEYFISYSRSCKNFRIELPSFGLYMSKKKKLKMKNIPKMSKSVFNLFAQTHTDQRIYNCEALATEHLYGIYRIATIFRINPMGIII